MPLSHPFETATEADWLNAVEKALKGGGIDNITRQTRDGLAIKPLYRETDFPSANNPLGMPGEAPFLRGSNVAPDKYLPWDIRQAFTHADPTQTNREIMRDLERGVSSIHLALDSSGQTGCAITSTTELKVALQGVRADLAGIALDHRGNGFGADHAAMLAAWASDQDAPADQKLAFNISPVSALMRTGEIDSGVDAAFAVTAALVQTLGHQFPQATTLEVSAVYTHESAGTDAQELGALMAGAVDTLRRLQAAGCPPDLAAGQILFVLPMDANYAAGIAKLRAARRLWARVQQALELDPAPMRIHAITSARMLTRFDPWVNMLRGASACFAAAVGGANIITVRPFNEALGVPEELGRRIARNTQIIAMEESGLGRIADPSGGAWFTETLGGDLAEAAWTAFQEVEAEGGLVDSLLAGALQTRIADKREALMADIAKRKVPITGVSEFALLDGVAAPVAESTEPARDKPVDTAPVKALIGEIDTSEDNSLCVPLPGICLAAPFETLRARAEAHQAKTGALPSVFLATLGPLAEHNGRADFARNFFAAGGIEAVAAPALPKDIAALAAAFKASGCAIAVICGSDKRYEAEAGAAGTALKSAGARQVWLAGKQTAEGVDRNIFIGCDVVHECTLALAELGVSA
ncbi:MAG: methylmalonyl-CoA mutase family protein [Pseudomonadota bacterium]